MVFFIAPFFFSASFFLFPSSVAFDTSKFTPGQLVNLIQGECGAVCDVSDEGTPGKYYNKVEKDISCEDIMTSQLLEPNAPPGTKPLKERAKESRVRLKQNESATEWYEQENTRPTFSRF